MIPAGPIGGGYYLYFRNNKQWEEMNRTESGGALLLDQIRQEDEEIMVFIKAFYEAINGD